MPERIGTKYLDKSQFDEALTYEVLKSWVATRKINRIPADDELATREVSMIVDIVGIDNGVMREGRYLAKQALKEMLGQPLTRHGLYSHFDEVADWAVIDFTAAREQEPLKSIFDSVGFDNG